MPDYPGEESRPPLPPVVPSFSSKEPRKGEGNPPESGADLQRRLVELEKRLQEEKEKVLLSNLRTQEEATYAAKVETAIKDVQDKLRRDRREAELEEGRLKLEAKIRELETRLVQERETWVSTLQEQVKARENQDKEIETHFVGRIEEMERRWLEEKAHWQKLLMVKDEEIRNLRGQAEKLKSVEVEFQKVLHEKLNLEEKSQHEKKYLEEKAQQILPLQARLQSLEEKERELFQIKAELMLAKEQSQILRSSSREREERLLSENDKLHQEVQAIAQRMRLETENEIKKYKNDINMAGATILRLRAVAGALERQRSAFKTQLDQVSKQAKALEQGQGLAQAELLAIQQRWQENELRVRREEEAATRSRVNEEVRRELEDEWHQKEDALREELEGANTSLAQRLEERIQNLLGQVEGLEAKLRVKNDELFKMQEEVNRFVRERGQVNASAETALQEKKMAQDMLESTRKALEEVKADVTTRKADISSLEEKLIEERERFEEKLTEERKQLEEKLAEQLKRPDETMLGQIEALQAKLQAKADELVKMQEEVSRFERERGQVNASAETALQEKKMAQDMLESTRKALEEAKADVTTSKADISTLEEKLAEERKQFEEKLAEELKRPGENLAEERKQLEKLAEQFKRPGENLAEERTQFEEKLAQERARYDESQKLQKESEVLWLQQRVELEKKTAQLKEQLENFSEIARQNTQAACRELEARIRLLEDEIEDYRKPKSGLFDRLLGQGKPKPPEPPPPPLPPLPPEDPPEGL